MIVVGFGRWSSKATRKYVYRRIYLKGYKWTPFCKLERRYARKGATMKEAFDLMKEKIMKDRRIGRSSLEAFLEILKGVEAEYGNGWIPCSERLPKESEKVLTCTHDGWISVNINIPYNGKKNDFECGYYIAWMPLPEPYKPEKGE